MGSADATTWMTQLRDTLDELRDKEKEIDSNDKEHARTAWDDKYTRHSHRFDKQFRKLIYPLTIKSSAVAAMNIFLTAT